MLSVMTLSKRCVAVEHQLGTKMATNGDTSDMSVRYGHWSNVCDSCTSLAIVPSASMLNLT